MRWCRATNGPAVVEFLRTRRFLLGINLVWLFALGCSGVLQPTPTPEPGAIAASPTATHTPSGDLLLIDGAVVRQVFIPDQRQSALYALTDEALFVRAGTGWERTGTLNDGRRIIVDPNEPERLVRGNRTACGIPTVALYQMEVSDDGGDTWMLLPNGRNIQPLAFDPNFPDTIYGTDCQLAVSTDDGATWQRFDLMPGFHVSAVRIVGEHLYVLGSSQGGSSRLVSVDVTDPNDPLVIEVLLDLASWACFDVVGNRIVVASSDQIYISDDEALNWARFVILKDPVPGTPLPTPRSSNSVPEDQYSGAHAVRIDPRNTHRIYVGTSQGLLVSQDDGVSWDRYSVIPAAEAVIDIQFADHDSDLYITTTKGIISVPAP